MEIKINYLNKNDVKSLKKAIVNFQKDISTDKRYAERKFWNNEQWEFFEEYFEKVAKQEVLKISESLYQVHQDIKRAISKQEIYKLLHEGVFYELSFYNIPMLVLVGEEKNGGSVALKFEPRNITLESVVKRSEEMETIIAQFDQAIADRVNFYKSHKTLAGIEAVNIKIEDPEFEWEFANVRFLPYQSNLLTKYIQEISPSASSKDLRLGKDFKNIAIVHFNGCSSNHAFSVSLDYFNRVFGVIRMIALLRLNRQYWTSRDQLEIPLKQPGFISSSDNLMWMAINPDIDNDFYVAVRENGIYLPVVLNQENVKALESYEHIEPIRKMLVRAFEDNAYKIDEKIYDALSWFSESLKSYIPLHKIVGLITALETLLTNRQMTEGVSDKSISEMFSERGAIVLKDTYEDRLAMKKKLKQIYSLRSQIVHGSERKISKTKDELQSTVFEVEHITAQIISKIIMLIEKEGIKTVEMLNDYVQRKLLS